MLRAAILRPRMRSHVGRSRRKCEQMCHLLLRRHQCCLNTGGQLNNLELLRKPPAMSLTAHTDSLIKVKIPSKWWVILMTWGPAKRRKYGGHQESSLCLLGGCDVIRCHLAFPTMVMMDCVLLNCRPTQPLPPLSCCFSAIWLQQREKENNTSIEVILSFQICW